METLYALLIILSIQIEHSPQLGDYPLPLFL